ncbi:DNA-binding protein, partial [Methanosalsum natronophilum]
MRGYVREVAQRIFAQEFRESNLSFKDGDDIYAPQYLLTPTAAKVNRLFIVGTLTETEDIGTETEYWRGRVSDPTGSFLVYAGQYQPEAAQMLSECETPSFVAVVGKPTTFTTQEGDI